MSVALPPVVVEAFAINGDKNTIPVDSQIPTVPGAASYNDGFPPLNMTPIPSGGIPPAGRDMNGILFDISAHTAWLQAGGYYVFEQDVADAGGYPLHAIVRSAADPTQWFYNALADNINDPDVVPTGWLSFSPIVAAATGTQTETLAAGQTNDLVLDAGVGFLDITANVAGSDLSGFDGGVNGQLLVVTNVSANLLTLKALTGSAAGNQLRLAADLSLLQYANQTFRYSLALAVWVPA